jgi:hypothetical protein
MHMLDMYVGDFHNPDAEKESWDNYIKRKEMEEANAMSSTTKLILFAIFVISMNLLYQYLTAGKRITHGEL